MDCCCTLESPSCVTLMLMNMLHFWSLAKEIAVLYAIVVWDRKACGQAASTSRLDNANGLLVPRLADDGDREEGNGGVQPPFFDRNLVSLLLHQGAFF